MTKRIKLDTLDLSKLEHVVDGDGGWSDYKWECYRIKRSETDKTVTEFMLRVDYRQDKLTQKWNEERRWKYYKRRSKYLAINGQHAGEYIASNTPGYYLFYTGWQVPEDNFPRKVLIETSSLAKRLGLLW